MIGQNLDARHSEARAEADFEVNVKAEQEVEIILTHLEEQNHLILDLIQQHGTQHQEIIRHISQLDSEMARRLGADLHQAVSSEKRE